MRKDIELEAGSDVPFVPRIDPRSRKLAQERNRNAPHESTTERLTEEGLARQRNRTKMLEEFEAQVNSYRYLIIVFLLSHS